MQNSKLSCGVVAATLLFMSLLALAATPSASAHVCYGQSEKHCGPCLDGAEVLHAHQVRGALAPYCASVGHICACGGSAEVVAYGSLHHQFGTA